MEGLTNARKLEGGEGSEHRPRPICSVAEPKELGLHQFGKLGFRVFAVVLCVCVFEPAMAFVLVPSLFLIC